MMDRGWKPNVEISPSCPRCGSSSTKFCYYNNYSLTQPRYFCKGCRRYWTKGGSLRNVPVGGGCRKNRRGKSSLRLSSDHHHSSNRSKSCPNIDSANIHTYNGTNSDGSHIDLALVYANFLNPQPDSKTITNPNSSSNLISMQELGGEFDPYNLDFTNLESNSTHHHHHHHQLADSEIEAAPLAEIEIEIENEQFMYYGGMDSMLLAQKPNDDGHKIINQQCSSDDHDHSLIKNGLPPLPGEEVGSLWSNSDHSINNHNHNHNHSLQITQQQSVVGPESSHDPNSLLFGNWCPFDLSTDDHGFSRT